MEKLTRTQKIESLQVCRNWLAEDHPGLDRTIPSLEWAIKELQSPWIKIEDGCEMPIECRTVLVCDRSLGVRTAWPAFYWHLAHVVVGEWRTHRGFVFEGVTHWMPLPEPPKPNGE